MSRYTERDTDREEEEEEEIKIAYKYYVHPVGRSGAGGSAGADAHFQQMNGPISNSMHSE